MGSKLLARPMPSPFLISARLSEALRATADGSGLPQFVDDNAEHGDCQECGGSGKSISARRPDEACRPTCGGEVVARISRI